MSADRLLRFLVGGAVGALLVAGCTPRTRPPPQLLRVVPGELQQGVAAEVQLWGEALFAELRDPYWSGQAATLDDGFTVWVGDREVEAAAIEAVDPTRLRVQLPADLPLGTHAVRVRTPGGREATLADALVVSEVLVAALSVEDAADGLGAPVGARTLAVGGAPLEAFALLRSQGGRFLGAVASDWALTADVGTLTPSAEGVSVALTPQRAGTAQLVATARDGSGDASTGALTVVLSGWSLRYAAVPATLEAGLCAGPVTVATWSGDVEAAVGAPITVSLQPSLTGVGVHAAADCSDAAATQVSIAAGSARTSFYVRPTVSGALTVVASATGMAAASHTWEVAPGPASTFAWDAIGPQHDGVAFAAGVRALDAFGNLATSFVSSAALSVVGEGTLGCPSGCAAQTTTTPFVGGLWSGQLHVTSLTGGQRVLRATQGAASGDSAPFTLVAGRSPPLARLVARNAAVVTGATVTLDATGSSDYETPADGLQYSFDFTGTTTANPPWTAWSSSPTASFTYSVPGYYVARVAVRDADGDIGYRGSLVLVNPFVCTLTEPEAGQDDGATNCSTALGTGGTLSLAEALRLTNGLVVRTVIRIPADLVVRGPASFTTGFDTWLVGEPGSALLNVPLTAGGTLVLSGLEVSSGSAPVTVPSGAFAALHGVHVRDSAPVTVGDGLWVYRSRFSGCGTQCVWLNTPGASLLMRATEIFASGTGVYATNCAAGGVDIASTALVGNTDGIRVETACGGALLTNVTLHRNTRGLDLAGSGHRLRNAVFTENGEAIRCRGTFTELAAVLTDANVSDGACLASATPRFTGAPRYLAPAWDDFRTAFAGPGRNAGAAPPTDVDVNDVASGLFTGTAPDLGAHDVW